MTLPYFLPETLPGALDLPGTIDHCEDAKAHTIQDYKGLPRFEALLCILGDQATQLESAFQSLLQLRGLDTANDVQLDQLGRIVGEPRKDRTDDEYRVFIRVRILVNLSNGRPEDLYQILRVAFPGVRLVLTEHPPMAIQVVVYSDVFATVGPFDFVLYLRAAKDAGVSLAFGWLTEAEGDSFIWNDESNPSADLNEAWGDEVDGSGPLWGGVT